MPDVNPEILRWARETANLTREQAVGKLLIRDAYGESTIQRLTAFETGHAAPTRPLLVRMAQSYRRPLLTFYLAEPPRTRERGADFRVLSGSEPAAQSAIVDALLRDVRTRQSMIRAVLEDEEEAQPLPFVGTATMADGRAATLKKLHALLGVDRSHYRAEQDAGAAFRLLRTSAEEAGVFVLLKGDLGSHHTAIDVDVYRGFVIADDVAPVIVINDRDAKTAWSFTLLHELVHLLLGQTGISGPPADTPVERFCNDVAGRFLLTPAELDILDLPATGDHVDVSERLGEFARERHLSRAMVAYAALLRSLITPERYHELVGGFERREQERVKGSGPSHYVVRRHRLGSALLDLAKRMMDSGALTTSKAARILGVKPAAMQAPHFPLNLVATYCSASCAPRRTVPGPLRT